MKSVPKLANKKALFFSVFFGAFVVCFVCLQLLTLSVSPLPWFDETLFASIAWQWANNGSLAPQVAIFTEVKVYGPIYFWLTGSSFQLFGLGIASFRWVNLLAGVAVAWLGSGLFRQLYQHWQSNMHHWARWQKAWWVLLLTDPLYYLVLHEGRMDLTALSFALASIYILMPVLLKSQALPWYRVWLSGVLVALAALTTPRVCFIFVPLLLVLLWQWHKQWGRLLVWGASIVSVYALWIFTAFDSIQDFANTYLGQSQVIKASLVGWYLGGVGYIPRHSYLLIVIALLVSLFLLWQQRSKLLIAPIGIFIGSIALFYPLIRDYGQYSVFILPFYYLLVLYGLSQLPTGRYYVKYVPLVLLAVFNLGYFTLKNAQVLASLPQRQPAPITQFVQQYIPKGSRVIGDPLYFYAVLQAGSDYQYIDLYGTDVEREARQRTQYQYQYMIVTDHLRKQNPRLVSYYLSQGKFEKVARLEIPASSLSQRIAKWKLVSNAEDNGYNCVIYQRLGQ